MVILKVLNLNCLNIFLEKSLFGSKIYFYFTYILLLTFLDSFIIVYCDNFIHILVQCNKHINNIYNCDKFSKLLQLF